MLSYRQVAATPPKVLKRPHVLADRRLKVLGIHEAQVLPPRITEDVTEEVDPPPALLREVDLVGGIIHLRLLLMESFP